MKRIKLVSLAFLVAICLGCTDADDASRVLHNAGYTDVNITGYRFFLCGEHDWWSTGFEATGQAGQRVSGAVCAGILKGSTIRFE